VHDVSNSARIFLPQIVHTNVGISDKLQEKYITFSLTKKLRKLESTMTLFYFITLGDQAGKVNLKASVLIQEERGGNILPTFKLTYLLHNIDIS
jgi:hypothetical protein